MQYTDHVDQLGDQALGAALLTPTKIYVKAVLPLVKAGLVHGIAHITGGGLPENLPRMYGDDLQAVVNPAKWERPVIFDWLIETGHLNKEDAFGTFNMGLGLILAVAPDQVSTVQEQLTKRGETSYVVGEIKSRPADADKLQIL